MTIADSALGREPDWVAHAIWWRAYPLGFVGAFPESTDGSASPDQHRLLRLIPWLDRVIELGASGIALGPIFASSSHGYDTVDHFRIDPRLGDDTDFDTLIAEAQARGLRVQLDGVFNHLGREHPLVSAGSAALKRGDDGGLVSFEGHGALVELDHSNQETKRLVIDVMRNWLDRGADAWRLDAAYRVPPQFWVAVLPEVRRSHPEAWFEAEVIHGEYNAFVRESTVDSVTQYQLWKAIWSSIEDRNLWELAWALKGHSEMLREFAPTTFIGNHDVTRIASVIADSRHHPHAVVLLGVLGGTPTVYAGDEWGFRGVKEEREGGDDAIRPVFPVEGPEALPGRDLYVTALYVELLGLRRRHPWLHRATTSEPRYLTNEHLEFDVVFDDQRLTIALNLGDEATTLRDGALLAADPVTRSFPGALAAHGWAIVR
ncbi:alpha-amylase family glycosyl hydrolase [Microbacterium lacticum]|uniref:Glycosidase n=1 Tax=Microbacterium lacticum TaxID=33885 RepID=A0A4Y3UU05_9MICO|nr:alpha-amylase family glycosyl hydrolase [Microbacterium lacticum]TQM98707.1 glycosidase [Microbacterium lacticum]GEB96345.1 alpha-amylase [Microbacterium lacticum]GGI73948.1 alpha-amylase [Microbacterium lacticum]